MKIGNLVKGTDINGKDVIGILENIVGIANIALIRINNDRLGITECYLDKIVVVKGGSIDDES